MRLGFEVELFHFGPISGAPNGVRLSDGREVLSDSLFERLQPLYRLERRGFQATVSFSDLFRVKLMENGCGLWLDTDVFLLREFDVDPARPYFAWEDNHRIGAGVFYLPQSAPMLDDYLRVFDAPDLMPHWLGFVRGVVRPTIWKMMGRAYSPTDLGITVYGNDAFTRLAKQHRLTKFVLPRISFYAWRAMQTERFFTKPEYADTLWNDHRVLGLHVHRKRLSNVTPPEGTMYANALRWLAKDLPTMSWQDAPDS